MLIPFKDDNPTERTPVVTYAIMAINVVCLLWFSRLTAEQQEVVVHYRGFMPARIAQLIDHKPITFTVGRVVRRPFQWGLALEERQYRLEPEPRQIMLSLLTCMFLHGGWMHLIGNMWFLWIFGNNVEDRLGHVLYLFLYLFGGLLASGCHWLVDPGSQAPVIGASGAVAAVLGAYTVTWPWARVHTLVFLLFFFTIVDLPALLVLGLWFLTQLLEGTTHVNLGVNGGVAWWAHVGGFAAGAALMPLLGALVGARGREQTSCPYELQ